MNYIELQPRQPENIALSFSGGGFRAATFGLGCLSYMETVKFDTAKMTDLVRFVSSASGGTFTAFGWTRSQRKNQTFDEFYQYFKTEVLNREHLIERAFEILKDPAAWRGRPDKSRNLINAFAMVYDEVIFEGDAFGIYFEPNDKVLPVICANTTEFANGEQFRFQSTAVAGNKFLHFKGDDVSQEALKAIKLGDILACSSCFTGGFEPVVYPRDFTYGQWTQKNLSDAIVSDTRFNPLKSDNMTEPICFDLMDGGIDDNQGINSFILAEGRLQTINQFGYDLYMACDVSSDYTTGYTFPIEKKGGRFSTGSIKGIGYLIGLLFILSLVILLISQMRLIGAIATGATAILFAAVIAVNILTKSSIQKGSDQKNTFAIIGQRFGSVFLNLPIWILKPMITSRATSTGYLATTVFLKKIRRISYDRLFEKISEHKYKEDGSALKAEDDPETVVKVDLKRWSRFCLLNAVYLLSEKNNLQRHTDLAHELWFKSPPVLTYGNIIQPLSTWMEPSPDMQVVATRATAMDTTLWFDQNQEKDKMPDSLIVTGQFTTCYNLLRYVYRFPVDDSYWKPIQKKIFSDWCRFLQDPFWLEKEYADKRS
jgi:hypothetical protein